MNEETREELAVGDARRAEDIEREAFLAAWSLSLRVQRALVLLIRPPNGSVNLNILQM